MSAVTPLEARVLQVLFGCATIGLLGVSWCAATEPHRVYGAEACAIACARGMKSWTFRTGDWGANTPEVCECVTDVDGGSR